MADNYFYQLVSNSEPEPIDFHTYDVAFHNNLEQIKRRLNAKKIKADNIVDNGDYYSITGSSGDIYHVNLNRCSCFDFLDRNLPCKHMYRFALEHGVIEDFPKIKPKNSKVFSEMIDSEVERFHSYYEQGLISAEKYVKIADAIRRSK